MGRLHHWSINIWWQCCCSTLMLQDRECLWQNCVSLRFIWLYWSSKTSRNKVYFSFDSLTQPKTRSVFDSQCSNPIGPEKQSAKLVALFGHWISFELSKTGKLLKWVVGSKDNKPYFWYPICLHRKLSVSSSGVG